MTAWARSAALLAILLGLAAWTAVTDDGRDATAETAGAERARAPSADATALASRVARLEAKLSELELHVSSLAAGVEPRSDADSSESLTREEESLPSGYEALEQQVRAWARSELTALKNQSDQAQRLLKASEHAAFLARANDLDAARALELAAVMKRVRIEVLALEQAVAPGGLAPQPGSALQREWLAGWQAILEWAAPQVRTLLGHPPSNTAEARRAVLTMASSGLAPPIS